MPYSSLALFCEFLCSRSTAVGSQFRQAKSGPDGTTEFLVPGSVMLTQAGSAGPIPQ